MQMSLCVVKLGVVSSIYGDFWEESGGEMHIRTLFPGLGFIKGFLTRFRCTHDFINQKTCAYVSFSDEMYGEFYK